MSGKNAGAFPLMSKTEVQLAFHETPMFQAKGGHSVTGAADILHKTILEYTQTNYLSGLELGCGNGIISLLLATQRGGWWLTGIDIQTELVNLAKENNQRLALNCRFCVRDLRDFQVVFPQDYYRLIYSNPPWVKLGCGLVSPDAGRSISRQELTCTMQDVLSCIRWTLHPLGTAWVVYPSSRKEELRDQIELTGLKLQHFIVSASSGKYIIAAMGKKDLTKDFKG